MGGGEGGGGEGALSRRIMLRAEMLCTVTPSAVERLERSAEFRELVASSASAAELMATSATTLRDAAVTFSVMSSALTLWPRCVKYDARFVRKARCTVRSKEEMSPAIVNDMRTMGL